ncbi:MAG: LptA/OstA family protein [Gammaproteobacteria bacterium]
MKFKIDKKKRIAIAFSCLFGGVISGISFAQDTANNHEYSAEGETTIETINGLRVITLRDNVFVRQGDIELTGDIAVLEYNQSNQLQQVRVNGTPANFEQQASADADIVTGNSETINYYASTEGVVEFIGSANFNQPGTTLSCAQIRHTITTGATSGQACSGSLSPQNN